MNGLYIQLHGYMQTGGITMYPLLLCCFWMWLLILYHLPLWRTPLARKISELRLRYSQRSGDSLRHNRRLYDYLLEQDYQRTVVGGVSTIKLLAAIAPLLGLFGTVTGMIRTFQSVATFGLGNPKALASGISEAMITTQFGLLIALPGILAVFFLKRRAIRDHARVRQKTADLHKQQG